ncbi:ATP-binding cassette domain-containing protein [Mycoplasma sp. P36-A1]|uniref:ATP-binding cassette domain-containing protein n=1 Tax=Mycoplasma sp. P36-A1 TaxID=3252900 RepID=UPI003C2D8126
MLKVENLSFLYDRKIVLDYIDIEFIPKHIYGLIGENGAGKSTLLKCLGNTLEPNNGVITYKGNQIKDNFDYLKTLVFLDEIDYFEGFNLKILIKYIAKSKEMSIDTQKYLKLIEIFNINDKKPIISFSKGMKKIVFLIIVLCLEFKIIILDEYLDGIDMINRNTIKKLFLEYIQEHEAIIILASHSATDIKDICDQIILMDDAIVKRNTSIDKLGMLYLSYQLVLKNNLNIDDLKLLGLDIRRYTSFENIRWISVPNNEKQIKILSDMDLLDLKQLKTSIEEVIFNEFSN